MATVILDQHTLGTPFDGTQHNDNLQSIEDSLADLGPYVISGLVPSAGAGLAVSVTAGVASIGGRVAPSGSFNISGLTDATTNHLYLLNTGSGASNTTGTAPANSVKLGTAVTAGGVVTSVQTNWASGRQFKRRTEDLVHGSGAGHPRAVDLASWHASNNEGNEVKGLLPASAVSGGAGSTNLFGTYVSRDPADEDGRLFWPSDSIYIERDNGAEWNSWGPIYPLVPPVDGDFTWENQGGASVDPDRGGAYLLAPAATTNLRMRVKAAPSVIAAYTIEGAFIPNLVGDIAVFPSCGLLFRESGTSKIISFSYTTAGPPIMAVQKWTNETTFSANYPVVWGGTTTGGGGAAVDYFTGPLIWYQIRYTVTHMQFWVSNDGRLWHQIYQDVVGDFFTTGPDQVGFFVNPNTTSYDAAMWLVHWLES